MSAANPSAEAWAAARAAGAMLVADRQLGDYVHRYDDGDEPGKMIVAEARHTRRSRGLSIIADDRGLRLVCFVCAAPVMCSACHCGAP